MNDKQEHPSVTAEKRILALRVKLEAERDKAVQAYYAETADWVLATSPTAFEAQRLHFIGFIEAVDLCLSMILSDVKRTRQGEFS